MSETQLQLWWLHWTTFIKLDLFQYVTLNCSLITNEKERLATAYYLRVTFPDPFAGLLSIHTCANIFLKYNRIQLNPRRTLSALHYKSNRAQYKIILLSDNRTVGLSPPLKGGSCRWLSFIRGRLISVNKGGVTPGASC